MKTFVVTNIQQNKKFLEIVADSFVIDGQFYIFSASSGLPVGSFPTQVANVPAIVLEKVQYLGE